MNGRLRLVALAITFVFTTFSTLADNPPKWMDAEVRSELYPSSSYYIGFAVGETNTGEPLENILDHLKQTAISDLVASIRVMVQRIATDSLTNIIDNKSVYTRDVFTSLSTLTTGKTEIPSIQVETYVDDKKHIAAVFAYVPVKGLAGKMQRQLMMQLSRIEVRQEEIAQHLSSGNRKQARSVASSVRELLAIADDTRLTMLAIDGNMTDEELLTEEWHKAELKMVAIESELNRSVRIFLNCSIDDNTFQTMLRGELAHSGCILSDTSGESEWIVSISGHTQPFNSTRNGEYTFYFVNAMASLDILNANGETVYSDGMKVKGAHTLGFDAATADAFRILATELGKAIINNIQ